MASLKRWLERRRNPWKAPFFDAYKLWRKENGPARLYDYAGLPAGGTVLDFGGFRGEWTDRVLAAQPDLTVHVFEPHPGFARELENKFAGNDKVHVHALALGSEDGEIHLSDAGDASSSLTDQAAQYSAPIRAAGDFFAQHGITDVALTKINIEGGEYSLLPALVDHGLMNRIARVQVQFHLFEPAMQATRDAVREKLSKTHGCAWCYPFVWEEWRLKP